MSSPSAGASAAAAGPSAGVSNIVSSFGHLDIVSPGGPPAWMPSNEGNGSGGSGGRSSNVALSPEVAAAVAAAEEAAAAAELLSPPPGSHSVAVSKDGTNYRGEVDATWRPQGYGTMVFSVSQTQYRGQFKDGKMHGRGVFCWPSGQTVLGDFAHHTCTGFAVIRYSNGDVYRGEVKEDLLHGFGARYLPDGSVQFQGTFVNNKFVEPPPVQHPITSFGSAEQAVAAATSAAEAARQAAAAADVLRPTPGAKQHRITKGEGVMASVYVGEVDTSERPHGYGKQTSLVHEQSGRWNHGSMQLGRVVSAPANMEYRGELKNDVMNGVGVFVGDKGQWRHEGEMRNMKPHGHGVRTWTRNRRKHAGSWRENQPHGFGIVYKANGSIEQKGWWQDGKFIGTAPPAGGAAGNAAAAHPAASALLPSAASHVAPGGPVIASVAVSASAAAAAAVGVGEKQCAGCGSVKSKKRDFSATQGQKPNGKCKECVGAA